MRNTLAATLVDVAERDDRVVLLSGDMGNRLFNPFKARFGERFFNCGVAEANMTSVAAGMALSGLRPVTYTIAPFNTVRCLEQIKLDLCYHRAPVVVVGTGSGLTYAHLGVTHHSCEDIAQLRTLPNMTVICPGDPWEARMALQAALQLDGPSYLRIGKKGEPAVHQGERSFEIGRGIIVRPGSEICLLSTGTVLPVAVEAAELLEQAGLSAQVVSMHTVKPLDEPLLRAAFDRFAVVATIEEHSLLGGFGSAVAEWRAAEQIDGARQCMFGTHDEYRCETSGQAHLRQRFGLTARRIKERIIAIRTAQST